ncbi:MAG: DUF3471 domain-containing protein, partial [Gemmatimonadetes bacterium]|nr:DUF3471 domain-containing protein [Gemmatimonadota bacterium]
SLELAGLQSAAEATRPHEGRSGRMREVPYRTLDAVGPAGAINSTVNDMTRWLRLHLAQGRFEGSRLFGTASSRDMLRPHMAIGDGGDEAEFQLVSYGMGWTVMSYRGHRVATHSGGIDGYRCRTALLPEDGVGTVVLTNADTALPHALTWQLLDNLLALPAVNWSRRNRAEVRKEEAASRTRRQQEQATRIRRTKPSHKLGDYAATYQHPGYGQIEVRLDKTRLAARLNDLEGYLKHFHYDTFEFHGRRWPTPMLLSFGTDASGAITQLLAPLQEGADDIIFHREQTTE